MDTVRVALASGLLLIGSVMAVLGMSALGADRGANCSVVAAYDAHGVPQPIISHDC